LPTAYGIVSTLVTRGLSTSVAVSRIQVYPRREQLRVKEMDEKWNLRI
jgi:hypothetical protein